LEDKPTTWKTSQIRNCLNQDFLNATFTKEEQTANLTSAVQTKANRLHETGGGATVEDKLFILIAEEALSILQQRLGEDRSKYNLYGQTGGF